MLLDYCFYCQHALHLLVESVLLTIISIPIIYSSFPKILALYNLIMIQARALFMCLLLWGILAKHKGYFMDLTADSHLLLLYYEDKDGDSRMLNFRIDFQDVHSYAESSWQDKQLFFDRKLKKKVQGLVLENKSKQIQVQGLQKNKQVVNGVIGLKAGSTFYKAIKQSYDLTNFKLWFRIYENVVEILPEKCHNPIFAPYSLQIQTPAKTQFVTIEHLSLNFQPSTTKFFHFLDKSHSPFILTSKQLQTRLNIQLLNQVQTIALRSLLQDYCLRILNSDNLECDLHENNKNKDDFGLFMFQFDPIVCPQQGAIELKQEGKIDSEGYYWSHVLLIVANFLMVWVFRNRQAIEFKLACFAKRVGSVRTH